MDRAVIHNRNLHIVFSVTLIAVMGVTSITPAFPSIIKYFRIQPGQIGLLITFFTLPGIVLTPFMGILADRLGRKNILVPSLLLFALAGFACMFTKDFQVLLTLRFFQGAGAAALGSINITLIGDIFSGPQRIEAMGYNAGILSIGTASYPAIGGLLAHWGWYYPFILPLLAIPCALWIISCLKNPEPTDKQHLKTYLANAWKNINRAKIWGLFVINILIFVVLYGSYLSYFPLKLENRFHTDTVHIGLFMSVFSIFTAITASQIKRISRFINVKRQVIVSFSLYAISMIILSFTHSYYLLIIPIIAYGMGHGMAIPGIQTLLVGYAPMKERAAFMSINSMVLRIGQTIGPLIIGLLFSWKGLMPAFLGGAFFSLVMLSIWLLIKDI